MEDIIQEWDEIRFFKYAPKEYINEYPNFHISGQQNTSWGTGVYAVLVEEDNIIPSFSALQYGEVLLYGEIKSLEKKKIRAIDLTILDNLKRMRDELNKFSKNLGLGEKYDLYDLLFLKEKQNKKYFGQLVDFIKRKYKIDAIIFLPDEENECIPDFTLSHKVYRFAILDKLNGGNNIKWILLYPDDISGKYIRRTFNGHPVIKKEIRSLHFNLMYKMQKNGYYFYRDYFKQKIKKIQILLPTGYNKINIVSYCDGKKYECKIQKS